MLCLLHKKGRPIHTGSACLKTADTLSNEMTDHQVLKLLLHSSGEGKNGWLGQDISQAAGKSGTNIPSHGQEYR